LTTPTYRKLRHKKKISGNGRQEKEEEWERKTNIKIVNTYNWKKIYSEIPKVLTSQKGEMESTIES
jgi:hypothetical protein